MATATLTHERLIERANIDLSRIDRENGVIRGVRIIGRISKNGREYSAEALRQARNLYEGVRVNIDHQPRSRAGDDRPSTSRFGWLANVRERDGGLIGDLHILKSHPMAAVVFEAAERNSSLFGLSHHAEGRTRRENGKTIVEEILAVRSVDLVSDPATTSGLFESMGRGDDYPSDPRAFVRALTEASIVGSLRSDSVSGGMITPADDAGESDTSTVDGMETAGDRIARAIREVAQRKDLAIELRSDVILKLAALDGPNNAELEKQIRSILAAIPGEGEVQAMGSAESFARCLTSPSGGYGGIRLTEAKGQRTGTGKAKAAEYPKDNRSFTRAIS